jgi:hypothetical protein
MKNRMMMLLAFLAAFVLAAPAVAAPPEEDAAAVEEKTDMGTPEDAELGEETSSEEDEPASAADTDGEDAKADADESDTDGASEPAEIESDEEAVSAVEQLVDAAKGGQWSLFAALLIMLLVYLMKRFALKDKLPAKAVPWVASLMSMGGYVAAALMVEGAAVMDAVLGGLATGAAAVGLWEMLFKHFLGAKKEEAPPAEEKEEPEEEENE